MDGASLNTRPPCRGEIDIFTINYILLVLISLKIIDRSNHFRSYVYNFFLTLLGQLKLNRPLLLAGSIFLMPVLKVFLFLLYNVIDVIR